MNSPTPSMPAYVITSDAARLDVAAVHAFLTRAYWSIGIPREVVERAIANSVCVGCFLNGAQVGFARAITDKATFAYVADVYVLEGHRGQGLARRIVATLLGHADLRGLRRTLLATRDAHRLYAAQGFTPLAAPDRMMEMLRPDVYAAEAS
jgi:GNAT superfamily N-acetyltransferase